MRKKYLSALLFGALLFASAGTFTSCKDYDDDISNLQEQIDKKASLEELQKQIDAMQSDVTSAKEEAESAKTTAEEALKKAEEALNSGGSESGISEEQLNKAIADAKAEIEAQMEKLASLDQVETEIAALKEELSKTFVTSDALDALQEEIDALEVKVSNVVGKVLNSLVFQPSLYMDGIEATEYAWMSYMYKKSGTTTQKTFTDNEGVGCTVTTDVKEWNYDNDKKAEFDPIVNVQYHINPSKAEIAKENLSIISNDAEVVSTRSSVANPTVAEGDIKVENGILTVPMRATGSLIKGLEAEGEGSIFALQANIKNEKGEDRVITSDYSVLYSSVIEPQAIAYSVSEYNGFDIKAKDCSYTTPKDELWASVGEAIKNEPTLRVAYDSEIDLSKVLDIHYNHNSLTKTNGIHKVWAWGEEKEYGLHYDFALIQYNVGDNKTSDSKYVDESQVASGIIAPRMVNSDGSTSDKPGVSSVGKHPLVRVRVLDGENRVVLHAYVKVEIVKTVENLVTDVFDKGDAFFGCNDWKAELTWSEISNQLIEKAGVSKEEFEALYQLDVNMINEAKQFNFADNKFTECTDANDIFGKVTEKQDPQGTTNPVLVWTLTDNEQQRIYEGNTNHSKTIYVRYVRKTSTPDGTSNIAPIYMPIQIAVVKPEGAVVKKIAEYWYNNSVNTRLNVPYPKDNGNSLDYTVDLNQVWEGNQPKFGQGDKFASYTDAILKNLNGDPTNNQGGYRYYFTAGNNMDNTTVTSPIDQKTYTLVDLNGEKYKLFAGLKNSAVREDYADDIFGKQHKATSENEKQYALSTLSGVYQNEALYATRVSDNKTEKIAEINYVTVNGKTVPQIHYLTGDIAKALLNAYDHSDAKLFAYIGIVAYSPCGVAMSLKDNVYPAYFLRPITMKDNNSATFYDAEANGSIVNIAEIFDFVDWRDVAFLTKDYKNVWLYAYYGLQSVKMIEKDITTNLNGNDINTKKLSEVTDKIKISQEGGTSFNLSTYNHASAGTKTTWDNIVAAMGKIKYENNGNNVSNFDIRIPVEFTYDWGTIRAYVTCHVTDTMGEQN